MLIVILSLVFISFISYFSGSLQATRLSLVEGKKLKSLPVYHGIYFSLWCLIPAIVVLAFWLIFGDSWIEWILISSLTDEMQNLPKGQLSLLISEIKNLSIGAFDSSGSDPVLIRASEKYLFLQEQSIQYITIIIWSFSIIFLIFCYKRNVADQPVRSKIEKFLTVLFFVASLIALMTTVGIIFSLLFESVRFFDKIHPLDFFLGLEWSPQTALREDQIASEGTFGILPLLVGTFLTTLIAMTVAVPFGLMSAIYLAEYAPRKIRSFVKPALEVLAGIPTVVYGFFAAITVAPVFRSWGSFVGLDVASESALAAGAVMGIMIIPFVSSLSDDVITAVPMSLREGSWGLGATHSETIIQVILPAALPGIVGSVLLAVSRAIGETMIVVMAAGLAANLTFNPLEAVSTVTVQIVTLLIGDQEFDSAKTLAAFALGLTLFFLTLILNIIALAFVKKYREKYD